MDETPKWIKLALSCLGVKEIPGDATHPLISRWWEGIHSNSNDDETSWCAAFVGGILEDSNIFSTRSASARSYVKWGQELPSPCVGAIVVFWRISPSSWQGHVGFVVGKDRTGNLMVLGGNQKNEVCIQPFALSRVIGYRWPNNIAIPTDMGFDNLPVISSDGEVSQNEV